MNIWHAPNVNRRSRALDTARAHELIFAEDRDGESAVSISRPNSARTTGDVRHVYVAYGMATEVLGDTMHRPYNSADVTVN